MKKKTILCFVKYYLPGYKSGGPVRTIENLVNKLGKEFNIKIFCLNRDAFEEKPYDNIKNNKWQKVGKAEVFYVSKKNLNIKRISKILNKTSYDILYLNSFFSPNFTFLPLFLRWIKFVKNKPCIIAPRGEFSVEALKIKNFKKRFFLWLVKFLGLFNNLIWQASSNKEKKDIQREMNNVAEYVFVAPDLTPNTSVVKKENILIRKPGPLRIIFISRITPMKNLDFLLRVLLKVDNFLELTIYGPIDDHKYWNKCLKLKRKLSNKIKVIIRGPIVHTKVKNIFKKNDVFFFPTRGENFGHIIFESLAAGTPIVLSDKTFWRSDNKKSLETLPLKEDLWVKAIRKWLKFNKKILFEKRVNALKYISKYSSNNSSLNQNKELFNFFQKSH